MKLRTSLREINRFKKWVVWEMGCAFNFRRSVVVEMMTSPYQVPLLLLFCLVSEFDVRRLKCINRFEFIKQGLHIRRGHRWRCSRSIIDRGSLGRSAAQLSARWIGRSCRPGEPVFGVRAFGAGSHRREGRGKYHSVRNLLEYRSILKLLYTVQHRICDT